MDITRRTFFGTAAGLATTGCALGGRPAPCSARGATSFALTGGLQAEVFAALAAFQRVDGALIFTLIAMLLLTHNSTSFFI